MRITILREHQKYGPYSLADIHQHLDSGHLSLDDTARYDRASGWVKLSQIPGVAAASPASPSPLPSPLSMLPATMTATGAEKTGAEKTGTEKAGAKKTGTEKADAKNRSRQQTSSGTGTVFLVIFGAVGVLGVLGYLADRPTYAPPARSKSIAPKRKQPANATGRRAQAAAGVVFNIRPLIGKRMSAVESSFGKAKDSDTVDLTRTFGRSMTTWTKGGYGLMVSYDSAGEVEGFILSRKVPNNKTGWQKLLRAANVEEYSDRYRTEFTVSQADAGEIVALTIRPK